MKWFVLACVFLNLVDAAATTYMMRAGVAFEANPVMRLLLSGSVMDFWLVKLVLPNVGFSVLWAFRAHRLAVVALLVAGTSYAAVAIVHLVVVLRWLT